MNIDKYIFDYYRFFDYFFQHHIYCINNRAMSTFGPFQQNENFYYDRRFIRQQPSFSPCCSTQPSYQTPFYSTGEYPTTSYNELAQYGMTSPLIMHFNQLDK